MNTELNKSEL